MNPGVFTELRHGLKSVCHHRLRGNFPPACPSQLKSLFLLTNGSLPLLGGVDPLPAQEFPVMSSLPPSDLFSSTANPRKKRYGLIAAAVLGLCGLGYYAYNANRAPQGPTAPNPAGAGGAPAGKPGMPPAAPPVSVEMSKVSGQDFVDEVTAVGSFKSNESVVLRPETAGRIVSIGFKDGVNIGKGSVLVALDAAVQRAELQQAKANLALAVANQQRNDDLFAKNFISRQALDNTAAALKVQEAAVALAEAKVAKTLIKAPFNGVVGIRNISVGDYVKEGQDLINIEDISTLKVDFRLPETYLSRVRLGQQIEVSSDSVPNEIFKATVDAIDPLLDANGRAVSVRARLSNASGKLRPGLFARVKLIFGERKNVLMVPEQALVAGNPPSLFLVVEGKAKSIPVKIGQRRTGLVEITEGLQMGDLVVTAGQLKLREGAAIRMPEQAPAGMAGMGGMGGMSGMAATMSGMSSMAASKAGDAK